MLIAEWEVCVKPLHVLDGVNRHAAFADLAKHAVGIAVEAIKCWAIERRAQADGPLMLREIVEASIRVFSQAESCEQPRRLFNFSFLFSAFSFLQVHLAIRRVHEWKLAGQSLAEKVARDFTRLVSLRQRESRKFQAGRRGDFADTVARGTPALKQLSTKRRIVESCFNAGV